MRLLPKFYGYQGIVISTILGLMLGCGTETITEIPEGDADRGATLFALSDGVGPGCQSCHCPDASGNCRLSAPNIQGKEYSLIDARTRDVTVQHPGGKFALSDQDIADLEAYLATLVSGG